MIFDKPNVYEMTDQNGQVDRVFLIPSSKVIFSKNYKGKYDIGAFTTKSTNAHHYLGPIYNTGNSLFSLKWLSGAKDLWKVDFKLMDKISSLDNSTFDEIGSSFSCNLIEYENSIELCGQEYLKIDISDSEIDKLVKLFDWKKNEKN
ncbi:hypothetical protein V1T75_15935 [Tenacibaculum sp. FZY0031]|uniref:hypothetical protein n=1 Tax=Tenacibaculum sp. FZY0031 TaxID=3116648 RepID=UPI002EC92AC3|nr:hypothetical protein [Tenacibaculum sp. FZY0031]